MPLLVHRASSGLTESKRVCREVRWATVGASTDQYEETKGREKKMAGPRIKGVTYQETGEAICSLSTEQAEAKHALQQAPGTNLNLETTTHVSAKSMCPCRLLCVLWV